MRRIIAAIPAILITASAAVTLAQPQQAPSTAINPVAPTQGFNTFIEGRAELDSNEAEGDEAIGGDLSMNGGFRVSFKGAGQSIGGVDHVGLVVGGVVDLGASTGYLQVQQTHNAIVSDITNGDYILNGGVNYFVRHGATGGSDPRLELAGGALTSGSPIDFATAFTSLRQYSAAIRDLSPTLCPNTVVFAALADGNDHGDPFVPNTNAVMHLTANRVNVFDTTIAQIATVPGINPHETPSISQPLVFNILDAGTVNFVPPNWGSFIASAPEFVMWNFPNATTVNIASGADAYGTIYAPDAALNFTNAPNINGDIIAASFLHKNAGEQHLHPLSFTIDCNLTTPTTTTTTTTLASSTTVPATSVSSTTIGPTTIPSGASLPSTSSSTSSAVSAATSSTIQPSSVVENVGAVRSNASNVLSESATAGPSGQIAGVPAQAATAVPLPLPQTGAQSDSMLEMALLLAAAGITLSMVRRRRSTPERPGGG